MDKTTLKILGLHRAEFEKAKSFEIISWICKLAETIITFIILLTTIEFVIYIGTVLAIILAFIAGLLSYKSKYSKDLAERSRRLLLLVVGLNYKISSIEVMDLLSKFTSSEVDGIKWEDENYYSSLSGRSYKKLLLYLHESVFFSKLLLTECANIYWIIFGVIIVLIITALLFIPLIPYDNVVLLIAKTISLLLMFIISIDVFGRSLEYTDAKTSVELINQRIDSLRNTKISTSDVLIIMGDYNASIERAPLIPTLLFKLNNDRINRLWKKHIIDEIKKK